MIGYVTLGTNDADRARAFYDAVLGEVGIGRLMENETFVAWGTSMGAPSLAVTAPNDGNAATAGNGTMVAIAVDANDKVDRVYNKAIEMGGTCEGPVGERMDGFYAGYFRDLDGNKLNVFCHSGGPLD